MFKQIVLMANRYINNISFTRINKLVLGVIFFFVPTLAFASWTDTLNSYAKDTQIGLYAVGGTVALGSLIYVGIRWQISRMNGDMETTLGDYFKQIAVIAIVGASLVIAAAAWQFFGGTGV